MSDELALAVWPFADDDGVAGANVPAVFGQVVEVLANRNLVRPAGALRVSSKTRIEERTRLYIVTALPQHSSLRKYARNSSMSVDSIL